MGIPVDDEAPYRIIVDKHFPSDDPHRSFPSRKQDLAHDAIQAHRKLRTHLGLGRRRERVHDTIDALDRIVRMERREYEVSGFGKGQGRLDGFCITHLSDHDDIRVFPKR